MADYLRTSLPSEKGPPGILYPAEPFVGREGLYRNWHYDNAILPQVKEHCETSGEAMKPIMFISRRQLYKIADALVRRLDSRAIATLRSRNRADRAEYACGYGCTKIFEKLMPCPPKHYFLFCWQDVKTAEAGMPRPFTIYSAANILSLGLERHERAVKYAETLVALPIDDIQEVCSRASPVPYRQVATAWNHYAVVYGCRESMVPEDIFEDPMMAQLLDRRWRTRSWRITLPTVLPMMFSLPYFRGEVVQVAHSPITLERFLEHPKISRHLMDGSSDYSFGGLFR